MKPEIKFTSKVTSKATLLKNDRIIGVRVTPIYSYPSEDNEAFFFDSQEKYLEGYKLQIVEEKLRGDEFQNYMAKTGDILKSLEKVGVTKGTLSIDLPRVKDYKVLNAEIVPEGTPAFLEIDTLQRMGLNNSIHFIVHRGNKGQYITNLILGNIYLEPRTRCLYSDGTEDRYTSKPMYINHMFNCVDMIELWLKESKLFDENRPYATELLVKSLD